MNQLLNKLERKFGRYAIRDLIRYVIVLYCAGAAISLINPYIYSRYLALNFDAVFHGQVWRLFTFLLEPLDAGGTLGGTVISILFLFIEVNLFLMFGRSLEQEWGTFRFNMYFLSGYLFNIIAGLILYLCPLHVSIYYGGFQYMYWSMFFAFALSNPDMRLLLYFVIPIKVKWLALLDALFLIYQIFSYLRLAIIYLVRYDQTGYAGIYFGLAAAIVVALLNFLLYFFATRNYKRIDPREIHRRREYRRRTRPQNVYEGGARHRCAICGRTELDAPELDFRFCSKCDGNYEYCSDHLFTHQHVKK
ncbi:MAG: hypothetical protein IJ733_00645 [Lachnospiraceae bacterium]|nr:hypothetical protein [Lachnospiraceae bacterium]